MLEEVRVNAMQELQMLAQNLEKLQYDATAAIQNKYDQLTTPVYREIIKAIEMVAREKGLTFVLTPLSKNGMGNPLR